MNANDQLSHHNSSETYYRYLMGLLLTEGVKSLADQFQCYWLLDIIASYQPELKREEFQVWRLKRMPDGSAIVTCLDGNKHTLRQQVVPFTDFKASEATVWVEGNIMLLPSEH